MRSRNIKPGFFNNDSLLELPPLARILFVGLWCYCDRRGRCEDKPKTIKRHLLPYDSCNCNELLQLLADTVDEEDGKPFIVRYEAGGKKYIQVTNFAQHQTPHCKEAESTIPAPDSQFCAQKHSASTVQAQCKSGANTVQAPGEHHTSTPLDSLDSLDSQDTKYTPQTPLVHPMPEQEDGKQGDVPELKSPGKEIRPAKRAPPQAKYRTRREYPPEFERLWAKRGPKDDRKEDAGKYCVGWVESEQYTWEQLDQAWDHKCSECVKPEYYPVMANFFSPEQRRFEQHVGKAVQAPGALKLGNHYDKLLGLR